MVSEEKNKAGREIAILTGLICFLTVNGVK